MTSLAPSPRRARRLLALVLPLVLLRLLLPAGFMPVAAAGGVRIGLCPGEAAMAVHAGTHAAHVLHHAGHSGGAGEPGSEHHAPCLFAASAAPAVAPDSLASVVPAVAAIRVAPSPRAGTGAIASIRRAQSARAPPLPV